MEGRAWQCEKHWPTNLHNTFWYTIYHTLCHILYTEGLTVDTTLGPRTSIRPVLHTPPHRIDDFRVIERAMAEELRRRGVGRGKWGGDQSKSRWVGVRRWGEWESQDACEQGGVGVSYEYTCEHM
jgi:hypothetical protein